MESTLGVLSWQVNSPTRKSCVTSKTTFTVAGGSPIITAHALDLSQPPALLLEQAQRLIAQFAKPEFSPAPVEVATPDTVRPRVPASAHRW
ncbi:MAG: hypothetical protein ACKN9D_14605 [Actinomycetales bacterium]